MYLFGETYARNERTSRKDRVQNIVPLYLLVISTDECIMNLMKRKHNVFTGSALVSFLMGLGVVLYIIIFRTIVIRNTLLAQLGSGYISLTSIEINGLSPTTFYRIMHNLTVIWSLVFYFLLMTLAIFLTTRTSWQAQKIKLCHTIIAVVHIVFAVLFNISLFLPVGDFITIINNY